jgi:hypothetical protein
MASSSTAPLLFRLLLICIILDVVIRNFEKPPARAPTKKDQKEKENKYENPLKDVEIDTSLDEDDDDSFVDKNKKSSWYYWYIHRLSQTADIQYCRKLLRRCGTERIRCQAGRKYHAQKAEYH